MKTEHKQPRQTPRDKMRTIYKKNLQKGDSSYDQGFLAGVQSMLKLLEDFHMETTGHTIH